MEHKNPEPSRLESEKEIERIGKLGIKALLNSHHVVQQLGERGLEQIAVNKFRTTIRGDFDAEEAVIDELVKSKYRFVVISEEHGAVKIGKKRPFQLCMLDGIDGTTSYINNFESGRYATMFGVFSNANPLYKDYLFGGIMEHTTNRLFYAVREKGAFVVENGITRPLHCSDTGTLDPNTSRIYADTHFDRAFRTNVVGKATSKFPGFNIECADSSAAHYADLADGKANLVIESSRKWNLEIAIAYGIIKEAGGDMITQDGERLGNQRYVTFAQDEHIPIITIPNASIGEKVVE